MKERLILSGRLSAAILTALLLASCPTETEPEYTVSFRVGEGSGSAPASQTVKAGESITLPEQGVMTAPSGKTFVGWKTGGASTTYKPGASVTITADTAFTAQWLNSDEVIEEGKTYVLFRNTEKFAVSIYKESTRLTEIALVPAAGTKRIESDAAPTGITFYPRFQFTVDGLPVFTQDEPGIVTRVDANKVNEVTIPSLSAVRVEMACIRLENQSSTSLTLNRNGYELLPVGVGSTILLPQERGLYVVQAGGISGYAVMRNTTEAVALPQSVSEFERGMMYTFRYNGTSLVFTSVKDVWGNWAYLPSSFTVSTAVEMQAALDSIRGSMDTSTPFVIDLAESFSLGSTSISGVVLMIRSSGDGEKTISLSGTGSLFTVGNGAMLTLGNNVTLQGRSDNTASLVVVNSGGTLEMTAGSKISGNTATSISSSYGGYGGGVSVSTGTFTMSGGEISGNTTTSTRNSSNGCGGGVYVYGMFTMSGGSISGNTASYGGGVDVSSSGTFTKQSAGVIYGSDASASLQNTASSSGHAVYVYPSKTRDTTAGEGVTLSSGSSGGWE